MGKQRPQVAPALLQFLDDHLPWPLCSQFDSPFSFPGMIFVCVPVLQYRNLRVVFKLTRQCLLDLRRNRRQRQGHTVMPLQAE
jgi:hypothetical protein